MTLANILDTVEMRHTLAALPDDPQLAALREAHDAQAARLAVSRARPVAIDARIAAIDRELVDADDKARRTLLTERGLLREERASLPARLLEEGKRYAVAELAVLSRVATLIRPYGEEAARTLAPIESAGNLTQRGIILTENADLRGHEKLTRLAALRAELAETVPQARELNERIRFVEYGLAAIGGYVDQKYGERVAILNPNTYPEATEAFGRRMVRALGAA